MPAELLFRPESGLLFATLIGGRPTRPVVGARKVTSFGMPKSFGALLDGAECIERYRDTRVLIFPPPPRRCGRSCSARSLAERGAAVAARG